MFNHTAIETSLQHSLQALLTFRRNEGKMQRHSFLGVIGVRMNLVSSPTECIMVMSWFSLAKPHSLYFYLIIIYERDLKLTLYSGRQSQKLVPQESLQ